MPRHDQSKSPKPSSSSSAQDEGARYPLVQTKWFERSLLALDIELQERIKSELRLFKLAWSESVSVEQLATRFEYKSVGPAETRNRLKVKQIRLTKDTRIHLTIVAEEQATYLLEVFRKSSEAAQKAAIERSCNRARSLRERKRGQRH